MTCEFFVVTDARKKEKAGSITFTPPSNISVKAENGHERLMQNIASGKGQIGHGRHGRYYPAKEDPVGWFKTLPLVFRGTYLFCRMVEDPAEEAHTKLKTLLAKK
jgi:hypothetical protein